MCTQLKRPSKTDQDILNKLKTKTGYTNTVLEDTDLITYQNCIYIPPTLCVQVVEWYHCMLGHPGIKHTAATIIQHLIWPGLHDDMAQYISKCNPCRIYKDQKKQYGHLPIKDVQYKS